MRRAWTSVTSLYRERILSHPRLGVPHPVWTLPTVSLWQGQRPAQPCPLFWHQPRATRTSDQMVTNLGVPVAALRLGNSLEWLIDLRKVPYDNDSFMIKGTQKARSGKDPSASMPPPCGLWACPLTPALAQHVYVFTCQEAPYSLAVQSLVSGHDWLTQEPHYWTQVSSPHLPSLVEAKVSPESQPSNHMIGLLGDQPSSWDPPSLGHLIKIQRHSYPSGHSKGFGSCVPASADKD